MNVVIRLSHILPELEELIIHIPANFENPLISPFDNYGTYNYNFKLMIEDEPLFIPEDPEWFSEEAEEMAIRLQGTRRKWERAQVELLERLAHLAVPGKRYVVLEGGEIEMSTLGGYLLPITDFSAEHPVLIITHEYKVTDDNKAVALPHTFSTSPDHRRHGVGLIEITPNGISAPFGSRLFNLSIGINLEERVSGESPLEVEPHIDILRVSQRPAAPRSLDLREFSLREVTILRHNLDFNANPRNTGPDFAMSLRHMAVMLELTRRFSPAQQP